MDDNRKTKRVLIDELDALRAKLNIYERTDSNSCDKSDRALIILNHMYQFVGLLDLTGNLLETNQSSLDAAGVHCHEVIGRPFWETPWWDNAPEVIEKLKDAIARAAQGEMVRFEAEHFSHRTDRKRIIVDFSIMPVRNSDGEIIYLLPEGRDITVKKETEAALAKQNAAFLQSCQRADSIFQAYSELLPDKILDCKYKIDKKIGSGGYGVVYQATHLGLNRSVAIKVFHPSFGNYSPVELERFRLEGISACQINHPNAVEILDANISPEGIAYLVMELLIGNSLQTLLKQKWRFSFARCGEILLPLCYVLAEAHRQGIIHRDVKPDNIFLHQTSAGEIVKLIDFGIAKFTDESVAHLSRDLTAKDIVMGTPAYMSPERATNQRYDGRTDIYSLGIMMYEMLTGHVPFDPEYIGFVKTLYMHVTATPIPPSRINPEIPDDVELLILRLLAKDPEQRLTASELAKELHRLLESNRENKINSMDTNKFDDANEQDATSKPDPARTAAIPHIKK